MDKEKTIETQFNMEMRKLIKTEHKSWYGHIDYYPRTDKFYGLSKTHKAGSPMHTITSRIG